VNCHDAKSNPPIAAVAKPLDLEAVRRKLAGQTGRKLWRSLDELAEDPRFVEMLHREFPRQASEWHPALDRRNFLKMMGASLALAGLTGCGVAPKEQILPYVRQPENMPLGKAQSYATAMSLNGAAIGLLVESHEGRPTKIEGNPRHPASLGATDIFAQASILELYDPDRSQAINHLGDIRPWSELLAQIRAALADQKPSKGAGLHFLTQTVNSPALASQLEGLLATYPQAKWHQYEPAARDSAREGARLVFGRIVNTYYNLEKASVIVSLDADFLTSGPGAVRYARDFAARRRPEAANGMARLYVVETMPSATGAMADHRLPLRPSEIPEFARSLAVRLGISGAQSGDAGRDADWIAAVARDLEKHRGACVVIPGDQQSAEVHALAHAMNHALGNAGVTVMHTDPVESRPMNQLDSLKDLATDLDASRVQVLAILGGNPAYDAPADLTFSEKLLKAKLRIHLSGYQNETSALCHWHVPEAHYLEAWGDARAFDGTTSIVQPLIAPLYGGKSAHEFLAAFTEQPDRAGYDLVREYWKKQAGGGDFEQKWRKSLRDGIIEGTALPAISVTPKLETVRATYAAANGGTFEIAFRPDPTIYDGRFANNGWLQELPKPLTRITWDNAAMISPSTAQKIGLSYTIDSTGGEHGQVHVDMTEIAYQGRKVKAATWIVPGLPDDTVVLHLGYGRRQAGQVGTGLGFDANALRTAAAPWSSVGAQMRKLAGESYPIACVQFHHNMEGRELVRSASLRDYHANPNFAREMGEEPPKSLTLYPDEHKYEGSAWGMTIDLNKCVGCNACVVACQSENNIPVVGKEQVMAGREMHWIRLDRYYEGALENPQAYFQPVPCMQCENAPCELVCPVGATNHSSEGLNDMVYNRCVGTRYCSNNCPYKVRRFNFLQYADWTTPSLKLLQNPQVTVRSRGVMEKCTYCVQRISAARIEADKQDRPIRDGEILTACQQVCPAQAITFGDLNDRTSRIAHEKADSRNYGLLTELNTRPRTTYLAAVRNPNPELEKGERHG
jgi:MoCo/4Fe-4S cofactor protein with predicted Tat translocation signal